MRAKKNFNHSIGRLISQEKTELGLRLLSDNAVLELEGWSRRIIRVRARQFAATFGTVSYAVSAVPEKVDLEIATREQEIVFSTAEINLRIQSDPIRLSFYDKKGQLLNADEPAFGISWIGTEVTNYKLIQEDERFIGMGEKNGGLDRRGAAFVHWNTDAFGYGPETDPLYASTPFYIGITKEGFYGIFLDNSHRSTFNFGASNDRFAFYSAADGDLDYYFIQGDSVAAVVQSYTWLTGRMKLPPLWSLGYQQCRYSYYPDHKVLNIARSFREKRIPADVIYLDIHYMDAFKIFTWHPQHFPEPKKMIDELKAMGFHVVIIVDPGIKREEGYAAYQSGLEGDHFVKYPDGEPYHGQVWPGWSAFPDFTRVETRAWWGEQFKIYVDAGIEGFWNDMNEPAAWGHSLPDLMEFHFEGEGATHKEARNVYGMQMARATEEGVSRLMGEKRPFVLTRAAYSGIQRYSAVWTGDNTATDEHMLAGVRLVNSLGLAGVAFSGYDLSGFLGDCSPELFARWVSIAAFSPFFRGHSMVNSRDSEPWSFGEVTETIARNYIALRYRLMPYIYSAFREAAETGMPVQRSLALEWPRLDKIYEGAYANEYMFGKNLLIAPVDSRAGLHKVFLPPGAWYDFFSEEYHQGVDGREVIVEANLEKLPVFVRAGAIVPMQGQVQHLGENPGEALELHIYHGGELPSKLVYYEDDGKTTAYQSHYFYQRDIQFDEQEGTLTLSAAKGRHESRFSRLRLCFHVWPDEFPTVSFNGKSYQASSKRIRHIDPVPKFDPLGTPTGPEMTLDVWEVEMEFPRSQMDIKLERGY